MKNMLLSCLTLLFSLTAFAQTNDQATIDEAKKEIEATFGFYPEIYKIIPDYQVPGVWAYFKAANGPQNAIPQKYRELINLAVAAQIPCDYCIYYHTEAAKAFGATEDEVKETLVSASSTRAFSMIIQGNGVKLEQFKEEFGRMMAYMAKNSGK